MILTSEGLSQNELFYTFCLADYIADDEEGGHYSTLNFWAVAIDGSLIINERTDKNGRELDIDEWDTYNKLVNE